MNARIYDVDELNRALPLVRSIVRDLRNAWSRLGQAFRELGRPIAPGDLTDPLVLKELPWDVRDLIDEFGSQVAELTELGLTLRDPEAGLVEACGESEASFVFLTWKPGEEEVLYFSDPTDPAARRQPLHILAG
ncbi:MAG: DUF2203 family protein [Planctomycetota bacterium]